MKNSFKRLFAGALALMFAFAVGCDKSGKDVSSVSADVSAPTSSVEEEKNSKFSINPLTGTKDLDPQFAKTRPVAIMVNNVGIAQSVQCGVSEADIVYETEVEGGITRLMAVYQNISKVNRVGTIRSARYPYIDFAMGHNAIYCHHGQDNTYAKPHLKDTTAYVVDENNAGKRIKNGKAREHTLYGLGNKLWECLEKKVDTANKKSGSNWQDFADEKEQITLSGQTANTVSVPFSGAQKTNFTYDASTQKYTRVSNGVTLKDYNSGNTTQVKNVFVLMTSITDYPDGYHRKVNLTSGEGYYVTNGACVPIKWSKGNASSSFKFTNADGSPLKVNAGNSWVCIANTSTCNPSFS